MDMSIKNSDLLLCSMFQPLTSSSGRMIFVTGNLKRVRLWMAVKPNSEEVSLHV
jgi:hypothetical protein